MARPKLASVELSSIAECTGAMAGLLVATTLLEGLNAERDREVAAASAKYEARLDEAKSRKAELEAALQRYYYEHVTEIEHDDVKHVDLTNGRFGRRQNPAALKPLNKSWTWKAIKAAVGAKWPGKYFHEPKPPELDKDALKALDADLLKAVGLKTEADDTFYCEPARLPEVK
jgi:hypothetical protein